MGEDTRHKSRDRDRDGHHRSREDRDEDKERRKDRDRHKDRDRDREKDRDRRDNRYRRDREKERGKTRSRSRDRHRDKRSPSSTGREDRDDRKRRREDSIPALAADAAGGAAVTASPAAAAGAAADEMEAARQRALGAEEARKRAREQEQADLEEEMEKRRKRIEAWQEQRRKLAEDQEREAEQQQQQEQQEAAAKAKAWTFEEESDEDEEDAAMPDATGQALAAEGGDTAVQDAAALSRPPPLTAGDEDEEEDPLDAFMKQNSSAAGLAATAGAARNAAAAVAAAEEEEEIDPLDAFMQANVLPAVRQVKADFPSAAAAGTAGEVAAAGVAEPAVKVEVEVKQEDGLEAGRAANGEVSSRPSSTVLRQKRRARPLSRFGSDSSDEEYDSDSEEEAEAESEDDEEWIRKVQAGKMTKGDKLGAVDHTKLSYPPFRRNFYIEVPELARMTPEEVEEYRAELDGVKVRGKNVPKPIRNWHQCGLSWRILEVLRKGGFERPLPIQAQALPVIMSGRDCIGIAKTGSGKTLGFVLPMMRHVKDQPPLQQGDGPVALAMAPTRELVTQIGKEIKRFAKAVSLSCVCVYGGSGVANQITELKRGTEIVVCTPGRMIDLLVTSAGKITNLRRVTYLVLDEADRMFDMGFEPQIMRIVQNIRPDRQTVMFSATFPRSVEALARQVLVDPVEIQVGGRSVVNKDITQYVELRPEEERFLRLLEVLGEWYEKGKILIFVSSQDRCDNLFRDLLKAGYPCLSLHGGKDQSDRESTIGDYKSGVGNILVATSVAARGLDVRDLVLVINYDVPNHHEDYVHRVGRTGRAGNKGTAITFIAPEEDQYAPDLVKALTESGAPIPQDVREMAENFNKKRKAGQVQGHGSGYGGSGFKFDAWEENQIKAAKKQLIKEHGIVEESEGESDDEGEIRLVETKKEQPAAQQGQQGAAGAPLVESGIDLSTLPPEVQERVKAAQALASRLAAGAGGGMPAAAPSMLPGIANLTAVAASMGMVAPAAAGAGLLPGATTTASLPPLFPPLQPAAPEPPANPMLAAAQAAAQRLAAQAGMPHLAAMQQLQAQAQAPPQPVQLPPELLAAQQAAAAAAVQAAMRPGLMQAALKPEEPKKHFETELEINDFPQHARWKITHRDTINDIGDLGAALIVKGRYYKPGDRIPEGERKLYLVIEGPTEAVVRRAKQEVKRILEETTEKAMRREGPSVGRYQIV